MRSRYGFSLVELLVVVAIIALLVSIVTPVYVRSEERARLTTCLSNQRQIAMDVLMWMQDNGGRFPSATSIWSDINIPESILRCPSEQSSSQQDYLYNAFIAGKKDNLLTAPSLEILTADGAVRQASSAPQEIAAPQYFSAPADFSFRHDHRCVASYCDGHAASFDEVPPFWIIGITTLGEFDSEVRRSRYPVLTLWHWGEMERITDDGNTLYDGKAIVRALATRYRGRVKVVLVEVTAFPQLVQEFSLPLSDAATSSLLVASLFRQRNELGRVILPSPDNPNAWSQQTWAEEVTDFLRKVLAQTEAVLK
jgi:prepilin-type N-terminal cleavage/methylation domain-containing protein/prepilin-type processing-associated H-X9-DG protein